MMVENISTSSQSKEKNTNSKLNVFWVGLMNFFDRIADGSLVANGSKKWKLKEESETPGQSKK